MFQIPYVILPARRPLTGALGLPRMEAVAPLNKLIQTNTNTAAVAAASTVVTMGSTTTLGNTLFATASFGGGTQTMSGGGVTTWNQAFFFGSHIGTSLYWGIVDGTSSTTITFAYSPNESGVFRVMEWAGKYAQGQTTNASGVSTAVATGSITPGQSNELVIAVASAQSTFSAGPTAGFTSQGTLTITGLFHDTATLIQGTAAAINPGWTIASNGWDAGICSFIPSIVPSAQSFIPYLVQ